MRRTPSVVHCLSFGVLVSALLGAAAVDGRMRLPAPRRLVGRRRSTG